MTSTTIFEIELFAANALPQLPSEKLKKPSLITRPSFFYKNKKDFT